MYQNVHTRNNISTQEINARAQVYDFYSIQMSMSTMIPSPTVDLWQEQRVVKLKHTSTTLALF